MQTRRIGTLDVSLLGLGTGRLASLGAGHSRADAERLLDVASELGVNLIDTADSYGTGACERLLGGLLKGRRDKFYIASKAGYTFADLPGPFRVLNPFAKKALQLLGRRQDFTPRHIRACVDASLGRLGLDCMDFFLLHTPPAGAMENLALLDVLRDVQGAGKIRHFGVSSDDLAVLEAAARTQGCVVAQTPVNPLPGGAHLAAAPALQAAGVGIVANQVFLSGKLVASSASGHVDELAKKRGITRSAVLLGYAAAQPGVACVLSGTANVEHLRANAAAINTPLSAEDCAHLRSV